MKQLILFLFLLIGGITSAQLVVSDPVQTAVGNATLIKNGAILLKAGKTLQEAKRNVELLKGAKKAIEKVSGVLDDVNEIATILDTQGSLLSYIDESASLLSNAQVFNAGEYNDIIYEYTKIIRKSSKIINQAQKAITDDLFKMNDGQRLEVLGKQSQDIKYLLNRARNLTRKYQSIANRRLIRKASRNNG